MKKFKDLSINFKIGGGFAAIMLMVLLLAVIAMGVMNISAKITHALYDNDTVYLSLQNIRIAQEDYRRTGKDIVDTVDTEAQRISQNAETLRGLLRSEKNIKQFDKGFASIEDYVDSTRNYIAATGPEEKIELGANMDAAYVEAESFIHEVRQLEPPKALAVVKKMGNIVKIAFLVVIIFGTGLGIIISRMLVGSINKNLDFVTQIKNGDLTAKIDLTEKNDEIGTLARRMQEMVDNLNSIVENVRLSSAAIEENGREIESTSAKVSAGATQQAASTEEIAATIEEFSSGIKANAQNAASGMDRAKKTMKILHDGQKKSELMTEAMGEISEAATRINDIIETVNSVAFQTNLLALNAAVEAARAGEHGKGFAVVAEEVRSLAQKSADAATQIKSLVEDTTAKVRNGNEIVGQTSNALDEIRKETEILVQTMDEFAASASEQDAGISELTMAISQVDSATQSGASVARDMATSSEDIHANAEKLMEVVSLFKTGK